MRIKHVIVLHLTFTAILAILFLSGCAGWKTYPNGRCVPISSRQCRIYCNAGRQYRQVSGTFKGRPHVWCEVWCEKHKRWEIHDDAIWYVKYNHFPREAYITDGIPDYKD